MIFDTQSFLIVDSDEGKALEIWYDWSPHIDNVPSSPIAPRRNDNDLLIGVTHSDGTVVMRKFADIEASIWQDMENFGAFLVVCGPSGVLARKSIVFAS